MRTITAVGTAVQLTGMGSLTIGDRIWRNRNVGNRVHPPTRHKYYTERRSMPKYYIGTYYIDAPVGIKSSKK